MRKAGWDTHGLPVELGVEKQLGITKEDIGNTISVAAYNAACKKISHEIYRRVVKNVQKNGLLGRHGAPLHHLSFQIYREPLVASQTNLQKRDSIQRIYDSALFAGCGNRFKFP